MLIHLLLTYLLFFLQETYLTLAFQNIILNYTLVRERANSDSSGGEEPQAHVGYSTRAFKRDIHSQQYIFGHSLNFRALRRDIRSRPMV